MSQRGKPTGKKGIYLRNNTYYARLVIPVDLREHYDASERWETLKTDSLKLAEYKANQIFDLWKSEFAQRRGSLTAVSGAMAWQKRLADGKRKDSDLLAAFRRENPYVRELTAGMANDLGLGEAEDDFGQYLEDIIGSQGPEAASSVSNIARGLALPTLAYLDEWKASLKVIPRTLQMSDTRLKTLADQFPSIPVKKTAVAKWIVELEGQDKAEATIKGLIGSCRNYYDYLLRMGHLDSEGSNPFELHKYAKRKKASKQDQRQAWELDDLIKLETAARQKAADRQKATDKNLHSLILLAAYTGARIEELAQLHQRDVKVKEGVTYLSVEESKSQAGLRDIPVHDDIAALVHHLCAHSRDGYLLSGEPKTSIGERSSAIGKRFGRLKTALGYDSRYVFHSLRKTLSTQLERAGLHHNEAAEITGHEKVGETYGTYSAGLTIAKKASLLNKVHYKGLDTSPA